MSAVAPSPMMTLEEMLALPDDGMERELIRGQLQERPMTKRNRWHSGVEARIAKVLGIWLDTQPEPHGEVVSGEAGFRLSSDPDSGVGIDVAYVSAEVASATPKKVAFFEGPPVLAVEILSPSDRQEEIDDKVALYLETGVLLVWVVSPRFRTVCVYRPGAAPELFNETHELTAEPHLPGFRVAVAKLFGA
jgi:Uma2 family endonuclease